MVVSMLRAFALAMALCLVGTTAFARGGRVRTSIKPAERANRQLLRDKVRQRKIRSVADRAVATVLRARAVKLQTLLDGRALDAHQRAQAHQTLRAIDNAGRSRLMPLLRRAISEQPAHSPLRKALTQTYGRARKVARRDGAFAETLVKQELVLARALLLHGRKLDAKLLPAGEVMPLLLATGPQEAFIQGKMQPWLDAGEHRRAITVKLEAWLAGLRSKNDPRAATLEAYLARYKETDSWGERWIKSLLSGKSRSRVKPNYRIEADSFAPPKEQLGLLPTPSKGFGYDTQLPRLRRLFARDDRKPWPGNPRGVNTYSWQLLARLQRRLIDLEASGAHPELRRALGEYLNIGFSGTGLPVKIGVWPEVNANDRQLAKTIENARNYAPAGGRDLYMALFGRALALEHTTGRKGSVAADKALAKKIHAYLGKTRLNLRREYQKKVPVLRRRVLEAYAILRRVAPELVEKLPKLTFVVGSAFGPGLFTREDLPRHGRSIYLPADSDVKSILKNILHEITHTFEYHGPLMVLARALSFRATRSGGGELVPLTSLIEGYANQGADQLGYRGNVSDPYALRHYADGYTEVHSVAIEKLASKKAALKLFKEDGHHLLMSLGALKNGAR